MPSFSNPRNSGFTLLEVLITLAILLVVLVAMLQFMGTIDQAWKSAASDPFAEAQDAFDAMTRNLAAATLASYQDYADNSGAFRSGTGFIPDHLARRSDLDFVCGPSTGANGLLTASGRTTTGSGVFFLAPKGYTQSDAHAGMEGLLNAMGYFVEFGADDAAPGFVLSRNQNWRWRLKQVLQPAESLQIFAAANQTSAKWLQPLIPAGTVLPVLAKNVVTLIVLPQRAANDAGPALSASFGYDSRDTTNRLTLHQLPPRLDVILVAIDETSAALLAAQNGSNPPQLISTDFFQHAAQSDAALQTSQLSADLAMADNSLTSRKIGHRIFQREILLPASDWSNTPSP
jgi:uncharacterized protein (TIGR02599 family)